MTLSVRYGGDVTSRQFLKAASESDGLVVRMRGYVEKTVRAAVGRKPTGGRPRGRPRKRWTDTAEDDLKNIVAPERWTAVHQSEEPREFVMATKTLGEY